MATLPPEGEHSELRGLYLRKEPPAPSITIVRRTAEQLAQVGYLDRGMADLLAQAFDFRSSSLNSMVPYLEKEFGKDNKRRVSFVAFEGANPVGLMIIDELSENDRGIGQKFWDTLASDKGETGLRAKLRKLAKVKWPMTAVSIARTIIPQTERGYAIQEQILQRIVDEYHHPLLIDSVTGGDEAEFKARTLSSDYYVYLNTDEITRDGMRRVVGPGSTSIRDAFFEAAGRKMETGGVVFVDRRPWIQHHPSFYYSSDSIKAYFKRTENVRASAKPGFTSEIPLIAVPKDTSKLFEFQIHGSTAA